MQIKPWRALLLIALPILIWVACQPASDASSSHDASQAATSDTLDSLPSLDRLNQLRILLAQEERNYALYAERSRLYYDRGDIDSALLDINQAIGLFRNGVELHYLKGFYAFAAGDSASAEEAYTTSIGLGNTNPEVHYQLGQLYFFQKKYDQALKQYQKAAEQDSLQAHYIFAQGFLYETQKRYDKAVSTYKQALARDTSFVKALARMHDLYLSVYNNEDFARSYNQRLLAADPGNPLGRFNEGDYHMRRSLRINPDFEADRFQQAINDAVVNYTLAIRKDPQYLQAYYNRGYTYFAARKLNEAIADFEQVLQLDSLHAPSYFMLGSIFEAYEDKKSALNYYQQALKANPNFSDAQRAVRELTP